MSLSKFLKINGIGTFIGVVQAVKLNLSGELKIKGIRVKKGDLIVGTNIHVPALLSVGEDGQILSANSSKNVGLEWIDHDVALHESLGISHSSLADLDKDTHLQYVKLDGRSGGQNLYGGTGEGENLDIFSTSASTAGYVGIHDKLRIVSNSYYSDLFANENGLNINSNVIVSKTLPKIELEYESASIKGRIYHRSSGEFQFVTNAKYENSWNFDNSSYPAYLLTLSPSLDSIIMSKLVSVDSWTNFVTLNPITSTIRSTLIIKPFSGETILRLQSPATEYTGLDVRYKYNEDGTEKHRIGFADNLGNWMFYSEYNGPNFSAQNIKVSKYLPSIALHYTNVLSAGRLYQSSAGRLQLTANASYETSWNRDDTSKPAYAVVLSPDQDYIGMYRAAAGSNPISWTEFAVFGITTSIIKTSTFVIRPLSNDPILRFQSDSPGYGTMDIRYKYNEDGLGRHRVGFTDGSGNWFIYAEYQGPVVVTASTRPTLAIKYASDTTLSRIFKSASSSRLDISVNAYYDGSNWQRDSTSNNSTLYLQTEGTHYFYRASSGSNPISFTEIARLDSNGIIPYLGILGQVLQYRRSGRWYDSNPFQVASFSNMTVTANTLYAIPFLVGKSESFDRIGIRVYTAYSGAYVRLGIYNDSGCYPSSLVQDFGTIDCSSIGNKEITISLSLSPGLYWLALLSNSSSIELYGTETMLPIIGADSLSLRSASYWAYYYTYGALPSTFPSGASATEGNIYRISLRKV